MNALAKLEEILNAHTLSADHEAFLRDKLAKQEPQMPKILQANEVFRQFKKTIDERIQVKTELNQTKNDLNETRARLEETIQLNQSLSDASRSTL